MNWESVVTLIVGLIGGAAGGKFIDWLRFKDKDKAEAQKSIHDSTSQALSISSTLLAQWIQAASMAEKNDKRFETGERQQRLGTKGDTARIGTVQRVDGKMPGETWL